MSAIHHPRAIYVHLCASMRAVELLVKLYMYRATILAWIHIYMCIEKETHAESNNMGGGAAYFA
eukprot:363931-Chlamydomonas_euryale.AAC.3